MRNLDNTKDILDSRDIIERIEDLESEREDLIGVDGFAMSPEAVEALAQWDEENLAELKTLKALAEEASSSPDWEHGEALIRDSYFEDYAQELAEDCGMLPKNLSWPCNCIDWERAARELKMDYFSVDFGGVEYWIRA